MGLVDQFGHALGAAKDAAAALLLPESARRERQAKKIAELEAETAALWEGFDASMREPERSWQKELDALCPQVAGKSRLLLRWFPGYPWAPVHRWYIYQLVPKRAIPGLVLPHLEGPDPRTLGFYDKAKERYVSRARVSRQQWDIYRESGGWYASTFWIIQGTRGGHKAKFTRVESAFSVMQGGPQHPPEPGSLPYAPFDRRVVEKLEQFRRFKDYMHRGAELERDEQERERKMRDLLWEWMSTQVMEELDGKDALLRRAFPDGSIPRAGRSMAELEESGREAFISDE